MHTDYANSSAETKSMGMFDLLKMLADAEVDYVDVGGLAVALHGYRRLTMDVDVVLAMAPENLNRFIGAAKMAGLHPVIPVDIEELRKIQAGL